MQTARSPQPGADTGRPLVRALKQFARRRPILILFLLAIGCNLVGSVFSIMYNDWLIVRHYLQGREEAFWNVVVGYNLIVYPVCVSAAAGLLWPLARCRREILAGKVDPHRLRACQRLLINLPAYQVGIHLLGWLPGAIVFPLAICLQTGWDGALPIWVQFAVSFSISALLTTVQTFFVMETFEFKVVFLDFFHDDRPADVPGAIRISFGLRMALYWVAVAVLPLLALFVIAVQCTPEHFDWLPDLRRLMIGVAVVCLVNSTVLARIVGHALLSWMRDHARATEEITQGNYDHRIGEKRPGELGRLTDRFNDMAAELEEGRQLRETFGQFVSPDLRDELLHLPRLGGEVQEITVMFVDIRGFTRRSAGQAPERVVELLNRFLSLAVGAIEDHGGWVNKFLGDGLMALFGAPRLRPDHADLAVHAAQALLGRLEKLNQELRQEGEPPLSIGLGIHTGPALVGSIGATLTKDEGREETRREFTAIGETVNLAQRLEQLTKKCGGPVLLSEQTRQQIQREVPLVCHGPQPISGYDGTVIVYQTV